jgi:hypothetical protein
MTDPINFGISTAFSALQLFQMFYFYPGYPGGFLDVSDVADDEPENDPLELLFNTSTGPVLSIVTPNVQREVRDFFGCATLNGAVLEDDGAVGTSLTHFETRVFQVCISLVSCFESSIQQNFLKDLIRFEGV